MKALATVSNALITAILDGLALAEPTQDELVRGAGLDLREVRDVNGRSSILALARLWQELLIRTGDPHLGLEVGRRTPGERFGLAVHTARNADTLRQALTRLARYFGLINGMITASISEADGEACFAMGFYWDVAELERHAVDITFAGFRRWVLEHVDPGFTFRAVRLRHTFGGAEDRYRAVLGAAVELGAPTNALLFDAAWLDRPMVARDALLGSILEHHAEAEIGKAPIVDSIPRRVSQLVIEGLRAGKRVELCDVATAMHCSPRYLQRKLKGASTSFSDLLDDARRDLAASLLVEPEANVEQVAYRLGYSEPTAFIRAFRKWFGTTPGQYRAAKR